MNILFIGAHPDDCEFCGSGLAMKYVRDGHNVRFLSIADGSGGHHEMNRAEIAARRWGETREVEKLTGIKYDVWNIPDCEVEADLRTRERLIRYIRDYRPDVIFTHRTNDYHADHRNTGLLVQDASYLLVVPNYCPDSPALRYMPVIMFFGDRFKNPPFVPDMVIDIEDTVEMKWKMLDKHVSQVYEWLPYTYGTLEEVPSDHQARYEWMLGDVLTDDMTDEKILDGTLKGYRKRFAVPASQYRDKLIERYGEKGKKIRYAEAYALSEYGKQPTKDELAMLIPY